MIDTTKIVSYQDVGAQGLNTNRAINNKWIGFIPLESILGSKFKNLELDLLRFTVPEVTIGTTTTTFQGISLELPTKVLNPDSREITFEYKVNEDWMNYKSLYVWASGIAVLNPVSETAFKARTNGLDVPSSIGVNSSGTGIWSDLIDCKVWLLNNYKKRIINFTFHNCFIKQFGDLALDYSQADEVNHSFTIAYTHMTIDDLA